jgi:hypothetical protein
MREGPPQGAGRPRQGTLDGRMGIFVHDFCRELARRRAAHMDRAPDQTAVALGDEHPDRDQPGRKAAEQETHSPLGMSMHMLMSLRGSEDQSHRQNTTTVIGLFS